MQKIYYHPETLKIMMMATGDTICKYPFIESDDVFHETGCLRIEKDTKKNQLILNINGQEKRRYKI